MKIRKEQQMKKSNECTRKGKERFHEKVQTIGKKKRR